MRRWVRMLVGAGVVALLLVAAVVAEGVAGPGTSKASAFAGPDFRISGADGFSLEGEAEVAWNGTANEYLIVWVDSRNGGSDIYGRRVSAAGAPLGGDFRISGPGAYSMSLAVAWNGTTNEYLVVWMDLRNSSTRGTDIYGRRVSAAGTPLGGDFRISGPGATSDEFAPAMAWNGTANQYLVVWSDLRNASTRREDIYARRVSAAGVPVGGDFRISGPAATCGDGTMAVAWNGTANEYLVVRLVSCSLTQDIYGRRVSAAGVPVGSDFRISGPGATSEEWFPAVAWNGTTNEYLIVWEDYRNYSTRGEDIYGRRVSAAGVPVGSDFRISGRNAIGFDGNPAVAWNETTGQYMVVWPDARNEATRGLDIYGRRVSAAGAPVGGDFRISGPNATSLEGDPAVAWNGTANEYLVVWQDYRNSLTLWGDIYGRLVVG